MPAPPNGKPAPRQHYLPAAFIGAFSASTNGRARARKVWIRRRDEEQVVRRRAEDIGAEEGLYTLTEPIGFKGKVDPLFLDHTWRYVENRLPDAIRSLLESRTTGMLDAKTWGLVLVRFVVDLFIRGPDFNVRFQQRFEGMGDLRSHFTADNTNMARMIEAQFLYSAVMRCHWEVMHSPAQTLVGSDIGYTPAKLGDAESGYAIPITRNAALLIGRRSDELSPSLHWQRDRWVLPVLHQTLPPERAAGLNQKIALCAQRMVFGSDSDTVERATEHWASDEARSPLGLGPGLIAGAPQERRESSMAQFVLITLLNKKPEEIGTATVPLVKVGYQSWKNESSPSQEGQASSSPIEGASAGDTPV
jgi:hypothetical protein